MTYYTGPKTLRNKLNEWFAKQNHIKLPKNAISKLYVSVAEAWTPANLFPTGTEEGLFLDFSDISTLYTDQTFSTNISAIGDPVGGVLDKSQGLALGAEKLTNGDFDTDLTGWSAAAGFSVSGGKLIGATVGDKIFQDAGITAGEVYSFTITGVVGEWGVRLGQDITNDYTITADGTYFITPGASYSATDFRLRVNTAGSELASISVKKLSGNHLKQATSTARPIWTRHPKSGVRNIIDQNELLNGPKWGTPSAGTVIRTDLGNTGPNGVQAWRLGGNNANSWLSNILPGDASAVPGTRVLSVWVRFVGAARPATPVTLFFYNPGGSPTDNLRIDTLMTEEWQRITHTSSTAWSGATLHVGINVGNGAADGHVIEVAGFQAELDATATDYQTRVSKYDVTEAGVDDCYGLTFDGVDDWMYTAANLDMSGTDKATWCVGGYNPGIVTGKAFQHGSFDASGGFYIDYAVTEIRAGGKGATTNVINPITVSTPIYSVASSRFDTALGAGAALSLSLDGGAPAYSPGSPGGGQLANTLFQLGSRNGGNERVTGTIYCVTLTDYILDAEQLAALETWTAARTPEVFLWPRDFLGLTGTHDYYIDATLGNDSNDGSEGAPWASLNKIDGSFLSAGATTKVLVRAGTYDKATDFIEVVGTALNSEIDIAFEPGCVMDGTATAGTKNGFEFTGTVAYVSRIYGNGLAVRDYVDVSEATSPNGVGNRGDNHLTVHDVYVSNCNDGFSAHADATMILHDCSASACLKGAFLHDNNSITEHYRCLFEIGTASGSNGANASTVSMALVDCVIVGATSGCGFKMQAGNTAARCQIGDASQRLDIDAFGATVTDSYLNVYTDGNDYHTFRRCYGKFSVRCRTPGGLDMQDCVIVGPATGQSAVIFSNFNSGGNIAMTFSGNVVATPSFQSFDATNAGQLLAGGATFAGNSLWNGAVYDADLDASLISGTITTDPQIGSADSYLMADYASAAGLAGFGSGDVVERPTNIPRELRDTI